MLYCCSCNVFVDPIMRLWFMLGPVFAVVRCVLSSLAIIGLWRGVLSTGCIAYCVLA